MSLFGFIRVGMKRENMEAKIKEVENLVTSLKDLVQNNTDNSLNNNTTKVYQSTNLDELKKLGELYKSGFITEDEFNIKKKELLK